VIATSPGCSFTHSAAQFARKNISLFKLFIDLYIASSYTINFGMFIFGAGKMFWRKCDTIIYITLAHSLCSKNHSLLSVAAY
jgi:hypothetical protein